MEELLGSSTVDIYNSANSIVMGFGFTVLGILALCYVLAILSKPFFYFFFTIKLAYQGIREIFRLIGKFLGIFPFLWREAKAFIERHPEIKEKFKECKESLTCYNGNYMERNTVESDANE